MSVFKDDQTTYTGNMDVLGSLNTHANLTVGGNTVLNGSLVVNGDPAWTGFAPVVTAASGTFTSATATLRYSLLGKTAFYTAAVGIVTNGTAAGNVQITLPFNIGALDAVGSGRAKILSGFMLQTLAPASGSGMVIWNYDGTYPGASGEVLVLTGLCEIA